MAKLIGHEAKELPFLKCLLPHIWLFANDLLSHRNLKCWSIPTLHMRKTRSFPKETQAVNSGTRIHVYLIQNSVIFPISLNTLFHFPDTRADNTW